MASSAAAYFGPLPDVEGLTVRSIIDKGAADHPDRTFAVFPDAGLKLTWSDLQRSAFGLAVSLAESGVQVGEPVGVLMGNGKAALQLFLGCMHAGRISAMFNPIAGAHTLAHVVEHSATKVLYADEGHVDMAAVAIAEASHDIQLIIVESDAELDRSADDSVDVSVQPKAADDALLIYTSGTTGRPKGVIHSHASLLAGGANTIAAHCLRPEDRALCVLPLCHINGQVVTVMAPLLSGSSVVMPCRFSVEQFWKWAVSEGCTWLSVVPTMVSYLLGPETSSVCEHLGRLKNIRFGRSASAPLPPAVHEAFVERFGIPIVETMGITETAAQMLSNPLDPEAQRIGSPGVACGNEVRIGATGTGQSGETEEGEIEVRGPNLMRCYLGDPAATRDAFTSDGWYRTGDLGWMDDEGYVYVTGRIKELIIKGGENISPREIDDVLYRYPGVLEAAAVAVPDSDYGEDILACVVAAPGSQICEEALRAFCLEELGAFKSPRFFHFMGSLPKGPSGKIQRLKLSRELSPPRQAET